MILAGLLVLAGLALLVAGGEALVRLASGAALQGTVTPAVEGTLVRGFGA